MKATYGRANRPALPLSASPGLAPTDAGSGGASTFAALADHTHPIDAQRVYNVKAFGAKGDGATDDRAAIQAALDAAYAAGGGTVFVPEGTYRLAYGVRVRSRVHLVGAGRGLTTLKLVDGATYSDAVLTYYLGHLVSLFNCTGARLARLTLDGNRANQPQFVASQFAVGIGSRPGCVWVGGTVFTSERSVGCVVEDVEAIGGKAEGIVVAQSTRCVVRNCYSADHGSTAPGQSGEWDANAIDITLYSDDCWMFDCEGYRCVHGGLEIFGGQSATAGVPVTSKCGIVRCRTDSIIVNPAGGGSQGGGASALPMDVRIVGNTVDTAWRDQFVAGAANAIVVNGPVSRLTISDNDIVVHRGNGISVGGRGSHADHRADLQYNSSGVRVANNRVHCVVPDLAAAYIALAVCDANAPVVADNQISGHFATAISLQWCYGGSVVGNTVSGSTAAVPFFVYPDQLVNGGGWPGDLTYDPRWGILLQGAQDVTVTGNSVRGVVFSAFAENPGVTQKCARNVVVGNNFYHCYGSTVYADAPGSVLANNVEHA